MRFHVVRTGPDWDRLRKIFTRLRTWPVDKTAEGIARFLVARTREGILRGAPGGKQFNRLAAFTIARKGHDRPLIDTRQLLEALRAERMGQGRNWSQWYAGIPADLPHREPRRIAGFTPERLIAIRRTIARIGAFHEFGFRPSKIQTTRPFLGPTLESERQTIEQLAEARLAQWIGLDGPRMPPRSGGIFRV